MLASLYRVLFRRRWHQLGCSSRSECVIQGSVLWYNGGVSISCVVLVG